MEKRYCAGGCGEEIPSDSRTSFKWGHKNGCNSRATPPRTALAKRERPIVIDAVAEDADAVEFVDCQISITQLDTIYGLLQPRQKAAAVLNALNEEA